MGRRTAVVGLACAGALAAGCGREPTPAASPPPREAVTFCLSIQPPSALVFIAVDQKIFARHGIDVTIKEYGSGKLALDAMLRGEGDLASMAEVPLAVRSFAHPDLRVVAQIADTGEAACILARRDRGIRQPADLAGKRVGTQRESALHFFLHLFAAKHGLNEGTFETAFLNVDDLIPAVVTGRVDACVTRDPYLEEGRRRLGEQAIVFDEPGLYRRNELVAARAGLMAARPRAVRGVLAALLDAERYVQTRSAGTTRILAARLNIPAERAGNLLKTHRLNVTLHQSLLVALDETAAWAAGAGVAAATNTPNFRTVVDPEPLESLRPAAVDLIW